MAAESHDVVVDLTLPSDPRYLALVRVVVGATAGTVPSLDEARIADLKLVTTELFANAMEANWSVVEDCEEGDAGSGRARAGGIASDTVVPPGSATVQVTCRAEAHQVTVTVADSGPGMGAADDEPHPPVEDPTRLHHERGLGIPLIQYLADEVDYDSSPEGTVATVILRDRAPNPSKH